MNPHADLTIDEIDPSGDGVATLNGRRVLVPFTIPGERVRVEMAARGPATAVRLLEVIRASPHRVVPRCRHFGPDAEPGVGPCGGCTWQHIAYPEQLRLKTGLVERLVRAAVPEATRVSPMLAATPLSDPWEYRQKVHFVFGEGSASPRRATALTMGHYVRGTRRIVPVQECPVHDARGNALAFRLRDRFIKGRVAAAASARGELASIAIRVARHTGEAMATIVATGTGDPALKTATRGAMSETPDTAFFLNLHPRRDAFIFGDTTRRLGGPERMREEVAGAAFLISPTAFFQTNVAAAELLVNLAVAAIPPGSRVLDLYAGAGLFSLPLAMAGHRVLAVEENREAVADGEASARLNRIDSQRCRFVARRAEEAIASSTRVDAVVLDPPRQGCTVPVLDSVFAKLRPPTAVYVSCNPEALAADLRTVTRHGYQIRSIQPVDMFPHTPHIETVVVLAR